MIKLGSVQKLQKMFDERFKWVLTGGCPEGGGSDLSAEDNWTIYMNSLDCLVIDRQDLIESFAEMVNFGSAVKTHICILGPSENWLLLPPELAEKCLVLGDLP